MECRHDGRTLRPARVPGVADPVWIADAAARDEVLITKDRNVAKRPFEAEALNDVFGALA
nr:hypothetical protein [Humibacter albus]